MNDTYQASMSSGPRIYSFKNNMYFYGACHLLTLDEGDRGKTVTISVELRTVRYAGSSCGMGLMMV
jgi:hypothetical protein